MTGKIRVKPTISKKGLLLQEVSSLILAFVFAYTAISKLYNWNETRFSLYNQWLPSIATEALLYGLPVIEIIATITLLVPTYRKSGLILSTVLMTAFTGYVLWVWMGFTGRVPCTCGGIVSSLSWGEHLIFNLVLLGIAVVGWKSWDVGKYGGEEVEMQ